MPDYINRKWYQEATINGVKMKQRRQSDTNEKRWKNLIEPLLPFRDGDSRLFVELGSNAGFYLRKMADLGFETIGVEIEDEFVAQAKYWEENEPKGTITIQMDLNDYKMKACQIVLLANIHYWLTPEQVTALVKKLRRYALYVIVVGRFKQMRAHKSDCRMKPLQKSFKGWLQGEVTEDGKHFGTVFKNPKLVEKDTFQLGFHQQLMKSRRFLPSFSKMVQDVRDGKLDKLDKDHAYYRYLQWRKDPERDRRFIDKLNLINDVLRDSIVEPLIVGRIVNGKFNSNRLYDGDHRYILARELGIKRLICKIYHPRE